MNGPEHYAEAERSLDVAEHTYWEGQEARIEFAQTALMAAQVHATLALTAATVEQTAARGPGDITDEWADTVWPKREQAS